MGQDLTYQVNRESGLECLVFGGGGEGRDRNLVLTFLLVLNYENHSHIKILASVFFPMKIYEIILLVACWSSAERKISFIN